MAPMTALGVPISCNAAAIAWATDRVRSVRSSPSAKGAGHDGSFRQSAEAPAKRKREPYALDRIQHPGPLDVQLAGRIRTPANTLTVEAGSLAPTICFVHGTDCRTRGS